MEKLIQKLTNQFQAEKYEDLKEMHFRSSGLEKEVIEKVLIQKLYS